MIHNDGLDAGQASMSRSSSLQLISEAFQWKDHGLNWTELVECCTLMIALAIAFRTDNHGNSMDYSTRTVGFNHISKNNRLFFVTEVEQFDTIYITPLC